MNDFERKVQDTTDSYLSAFDIKTLQVNVGLLCNKQCIHCHVQASPTRTEIMNWTTMQLILDKASEIQPELVDITGGAPEMNPNLKRFVQAFRENNYTVQVRTNLTVLLEPKMEGMINFYRENNIKLVASLPCYFPEEVDSIRGDGTFLKSIKALKLLNASGYGADPNLVLDLVFNPEGAFLPPEQSALESEYHSELKKFGIIFNKLIAITNMPVGRFSEYLQKQENQKKYSKLLKDNFNYKTLDGLMCRNQIDVGWDGKIYDCDFNLALNLPIVFGVSSHLEDFNLELLSNRKILTGDHCFGCTAGAGSSCGGALLD
jgi:radical SAM/Cys-rich protein